MAYGTAPHRVRPGVWATQDGRILTPAGSAYWEHHHQQGLVTADGHVTTSGIINRVASPTRSILPAPPPPRRTGQPTITRPQWRGMTPKQKMETQVTVALSPAQRARIARRNAAPVARVPTKVNVPIGFGGASAIDQRMKAEAAAEAAYKKAHPPKPTTLEFARAYARDAQGKLLFPEANAKVRAYNAAGSTLWKPVSHALDVAGGFGAAMGMGIANDLGLTNLKFGSRHAEPGGLSSFAVPGVSHQTIRQGGQFTEGVLKNVIGPNLTEAFLTGSFDPIAKHPGWSAVEAAGLLPIPGLGAARSALRARRLARIGDEALKIGEDAKAIRALRIEEWKRAGIPEDQIQHALTFYDNQAALYHGGSDAFWTDKIGLPSGRTAAEHVAAGGTNLYQPSHIPNVTYPETKQAGRLKAKLNPRKGAATGIPRTPDLWTQTADGQRFKLAGNITPQDWVERVRAVVRSPAERDALARWYEHYAPMFRKAFGQDADEIMRGFAVSQANASPSSGLGAVLKVMDRLRAGRPLTRNEYSVVGLSIQKAVQNKEIDSHVAAKLSDFVDSLAGKDTRTWMGDVPEAGSPAAIDVHAIRDRGFIDKKLQARVEKIGATLGKDFQIEGTGAATGPLYERISEWYHEIADHLNEIHFDGRSDWTPAQAQALGWSTIQKAHGVPPEGFTEAFARNARDITFELTRGATNLGADLTSAQARQVAKAMLPHARALAEDIPGLYVQDVKVGIGGWGQGSNINISVKVIGTRQAVQDALPHFAQAFDQEWVQASREVTGKESRAALVITSPAFKNPRTIARFWRILNKIEPKLEGYMQYEIDGVPGIAIRTGSRNVSPKTAEKFRAKWAAAVTQAEKEAGIEVGYTARNIELLTGGQHGAVDPLQTLAGSGGGRRLGALEHPRSGGIRDALESEIARARGEPGAAIPGGEPGAIAPGRSLYQRSPDPASQLPRGATEFLKGGKTRLHFFEGADISTLLHELFHVSMSDMRGRHLATLGNEYAGGKALADWTDAEHEAVAQAFEHWLHTGEIKNPKLKAAFQAVKDWMAQILGRAKAAGMKVPADIEEAFNYMFREPKDLKGEVITAAHRAKSEVYPVQEIKRKAQRAERFSASEAAREAAGGGYAGQEAALRELTGEYWKEPFNDLTHLEQDDMETLFTAVGQAKKLSGIQKTSLIEALRAANRGEVFRPSDADLVFKAFGHTKASRKGLTRTQRALDILTQIVNIPRSFMSSFDVSGILRQGVMTVVMHPVMSAKLTPQMMRYLFSEKYYLERMARYRNDARYHLLVDEGGLELTDTGHVAHNSGEEAYQSQLAEKMTGGKWGPVRASGRAYTGLLNDMRWGSATNMFDLAKENNMLTGEELQRIGKVSNWATGRGTLGKHEQSAQLLNLFLFSPRLLSSRLQTFNPWFYKSLDPEQRLLFIRWASRTPSQKQALKATARLFLAGGSILALAKLAGADIELDPTSSDFGKIRVGNTRVDIWGGHQAVVRTFFQSLLRQRKITSTGEIRHTNFLDPIFRFFEGKASPPMSLAFDIHRGKTFTGDPFYWGDPRKSPLDPGSFWNPGAAMGSRLWPLGFQDTYEAYGQADDAAVAALVWALSQVGFSTQTYPDEQPKSKGGGGGGRDWGLPTDTGGGGRTDWGLPDTGDSGARTDWGTGG